MSSEWSSIVSTLAEDDSSNGAPKMAHKQSERPRRYAYPGTRGASSLASILERAICRCNILNYSAAAGRSACDSPRDPEAAIIDCTQSINSGKWKGHDLAAFYNNRAAAYRAKGDNDRAMTDLNGAIRLDPKLSMAFNNRGAYHDKGDNDRAIADYSEAIRLDPKSAMAYSARGRSYLFAGTVERALADFNQASVQEPKDAHIALWVDIVSRRNNLPSRLSQAISQIDMTVWPAPVIRLFMDPDGTRRCTRCRGRSGRHQEEDSSPRDEFLQRGAFVDEGVER